MKKILLILAAVATISACSDGNNNGGDGGAVVRSYALTIRADEWVDEDGYFVSKTLVEDAITNDVYDFGDIEVYVYDGDMQFPLPWTWHKWYETGDPANPLVYYTTTMDYAFAPGRIYFYYTNSDYGYDPGEPGRRDFRVVTTLY